jgi:hypothetical protein
VPFVLRWLPQCLLQTGNSESTKEIWLGQMVCAAVRCCGFRHCVYIGKLHADLPFPYGWILPGYYPVIGNGYLALETGPFVVPWANIWPWKDAGSIHVAGVNNGQSFAGPMGPSHRAQVPNPLNPVLLQDQAGSYVNWGSAVDYGRAVSCLTLPCQCNFV